MIPYYLILEVEYNASDEDIRNSYLRLIKNYTPEKHPVKFQQINSAYENIKSKRRRIKGKIFGGLKENNCEEALYRLVKAKKIKRCRVGLNKLLQAAENA